MWNRNSKQERRFNKGMKFLSSNYKDNNMTDLEKLKSLTAQIDGFLANNINPESEVFTTWKTKTKRLLERIYGKQSEEYKTFCKTSFTSMIYTTASDDDALDRRACRDALSRIRPVLKVYIEELEEETHDSPQASVQEQAKVSEYKRVFIVHGHDGELKERIARLLEKQKIEAIILGEQTNKGKTVIEKFEAYADTVDAAICLFTADDDIADGSKRARQNVVFETGYFYGKIGREKTIVIAEDGVMNLSDLQGVVYVDKNNWEADVLKELMDIGYNIDFNILFGK